MKKNKEIEQGSEEAKSAIVLKLRKMNMTIEQIAQITELPVEKVKLIINN